jgi:surface antigen
VGASLDQQDCAQAQLALQQMANQPTGQQIPWSNSNSGDHGALTPTSNAIVAANGQLCRNYHTDAVAKDGSVTSHDGLTCRDASTGDWKAVS